MNIFNQMRIVTITPLSDEHPLAGLVRIKGGNPSERLQYFTSVKMDSYSEFEKAATVHPKPIGCQILVDLGCNQKCVHCFLGEPDSRPRSTKDIILEVSKEVENAGLHGIPYAGEPMFNEDAFQSYMKILPQPYEVLSNGTTPYFIANPTKIVNQIVKKGFRKLRLSLHGATARTHESITGIPGSFQTIINTMEQLKPITSTKTIALLLNVVVHRENIDELDKLFELAAENNVRSLYLIRIIPRNKETPAHLLLNKEHICKALYIISKARQKYQRTLYIEMGVSWGPNFHNPGMWNYMISQLVFGVPGHYCKAMGQTLAIEPSKRTLYPCMIAMGDPRLKLGTFQNSNFNYNKLGDALKNWHIEWSQKAHGKCSTQECAYSSVCHGGCRISAISEYFINSSPNQKGELSTSFSENDWYVPFTNCITPLLKELVDKE
jgi:radical SAM protein with 4Fe4S-binding SPASM domain